MASLWSSCPSKHRRLRASFSQFPVARLIRLFAGGFSTKSRSINRLIFLTNSAISAGRASRPIKRSTILNDPRFIMIRRISEPLRVRGTFPIPVASDTLQGEELSMQGERLQQLFGPPDTGELLFLKVDENEACRPFSTTTMTELYDLLNHSRAVRTAPSARSAFRPSVEKLLRDPSVKQSPSWRLSTFPSP